MLNCGKWSLNSSLLCNSCLTDWLFLIKLFHLLTCRPTAWVSHKKSSGKTYGCFLLTFESVCSCILKSLFHWKSGVMRQYQQFFIKHVYQGKIAWKKSKRSWAVLGITAWIWLKASKKKKKTRMVVTIQHCIVLNTFNRQSKVYK